MSIVTYLRFLSIHFVEDFLLNLILEAVLGNVAYKFEIISFSPHF